MKKTVRFLAFLVATALILPVFTLITAADEWGRPEDYGSPEYPQKYGIIGSDINVSTLTESLEIRLIPDRKTLDGGRIDFTLNVRGGEEGLSVNAVGVIPVYDTSLFEPVATDPLETPESSLAGKFGFEKDPTVMSSRWTANMAAYTVAAAWPGSDPVLLPEGSDIDFYSFSLVPKKPGDGEQMPQTTTVYAYVTFKRGGLEFSRLVSVIIGDDDRMIVSAGVSIRDGLVLAVSARVPETVTEPAMRFLMENKEPVTVQGEKDGELWKFEFGGIGYENMTDRIKFELLGGTDVLDSRAGFTVKTYAATLLRSGAAFEAKRLAGRLLMYGAEVQKITGYKTDELATDGVDELSDAVMFADIAPPPADRSVISYGDVTTAVNGTGFGIGGDFTFRFSVSGVGETARAYFDDSPMNSLEIAVRETEDGFAVTCGKTFLTGLDRIFVFENGNGNSAALRANDIVAALWDSDTEGPLVKALYALSIAAKLYEGYNTR